MLEKVLEFSRVDGSRPKTFMKNGSCAKKTWYIYIWYVNINIIHEYIHWYENPWWLQQILFFLLGEPNESFGPTARNGLTPFKPSSVTRFNQSFPNDGWWSHVLTPEKCSFFNQTSSIWGWNHHSPTAILQPWCSKKWACLKLPLMPASASLRDWQLPQLAKASNQLAQSLKNCNLSSITRIKSSKRNMRTKAESM